MEPRFFMEPIIDTMEHIALGEDGLSEMRTAHKVVIWGTARAAEFALSLCQKYGIRPAYIVDSFFHERDELWNGIPLIGQDILFSLPVDYFVIIACHEKYGIREKLTSRNIPCAQLQSEPLSLVEYPEDTRLLMDQKRADIESVFGQLSDKKSKEVYLHTVNCRRNFAPEHVTALEQLCNWNQYFGNDIVPYIQGDTVIDCGAYTGDTLETFLNAPNCRCQSYFALEPTPEYFSAIVNYVQDHKLQKQVRPLQIAVWDRCEDLSFLASADTGNAVAYKGGITVHADTIDHILSGHHGKVNFIKMDIEGSEVHALRGAKEVICRDHPVLAICIYHRVPDLWEIPLLILSMYGGYRLYVRHHSKGIGETVLYAIP